VNQGDGDHWKIVYPKIFRHEDMLSAARRQLIQCDGSPMVMGRASGAWEALMILTEMAERYSAQALTSSVTPFVRRA
jgi:hypothetical protein